MILQLDSLYRDYEKYPYNSCYQITVNGTPPDNNKQDDVRSTYLTQNYIEHAFYWIGNSSFNNPFSKVKNDTFVCKIIPIAKNRCILIPDSEITKRAIDTIHYFNGLIFYNKFNNQSATILNYDKEFYFITLNKPIFTKFYEHLMFEDCQHHLQEFKEYLLDGYIINTSYHENTNINLLGVTEIEYQPNEKFLINKGVYKSMIVENVTKNWKSEIENVRGVFRHVVLREMPSYDSNDFFIVYKNPVNKRYVSEQQSFENGLMEYKVTSQSNTILPGSTFTDGNIEIIVDSIKNDGTILTTIVQPGANIENGKDYVLQNNQQQTISILVTEIGNGFVLTESIQLYSPESVVGIINKQRNLVQYYTIHQILKNIVYINYAVNDLREINSDLPIYLYFVPFEKIFPNVVIPMIPTQNIICVEMQLVSLSLPNLPICGYNIRLADIPYILVNLSNSTGKGQGNLGTIYSNVQSAVNHNFVCPIANIRAPRNNFVVISCRQKAIFKFSARDTLDFKVSLPSGEKLSFVSNRFQKVFSCPPLNIPLNRNHVRNEKKVYPYILNFGITAVFEMKIL
jgi:hypothetical protein